MIRGSSGSGKSTLAIQLIALGAQLVSDDRAILERRGASVYAAAPEPLRGLIEFRGIGLLRSPSIQTNLTAVVDLNGIEESRLPEFSVTEILGVRLTVLRKVDNPGFASALALFIRNGRYDHDS
ncbi:MAG: HPr kinase/phosphorylase [Paracoccaceae bacterium]